MSKLLNCLWISNSSMRLLRTSLYRRFDAQNKKKIKVNLIDGDRYVLQHKIKKIQFLKIDIEGMEYDALLGLEKSIRLGMIELIQFEYGEFNIQSERLLKHFYSLLDTFAIGRLHPQHIEFMDWNCDLENFRPANYIAILKTNNELISYLEK